MKLLLLVLAILLVSSMVVEAGGFQLYSESATDVLGVGGAAVAREGHASSAWYNPAATTTVTVPTITGGGSLLKLSSDYTTSAGRDYMDDQFRATGFFYSVLPLEEDWRLTLSVNVPNGMITQWDSDSQLRDLATFTSLRVCYISPGIAYKISDELSVAGGVNEAIGVARMASYIDLKKYGLKENKMYMRAEGEGTGFFTSVHYRPWDDWSFGAHYQSRVKIDFDGSATYRNRASYYGGLIRFKKDDASTTMNMPAYLALGVENRSFDKWRLMADAVWTQWSCYKSLDIHFDSYPGTTKKGTSRNERDWHDVWSYRLGAEYQLTDQWVLRGGYMYDFSPANSRSISPEMPDSDKQLFAVGCGYQTPTWGFDLAYGYVYFIDGKLGSRIAREKGYERGTFDTDCHILSAQLTFRF